MIWKALTENKLGITLISLALVAILTLGVAQGCDTQKMVKVDVPQRIQESTDVGPTVTLREAGVVFEDWKATVERDSRRFVTNIEDAQKREAFIKSLFQLGLSELSNVAGGAGVPLGGLLTTLLAGAGGLMLKRPGTDKDTAKEKEASYNAGLQNRVLKPIQDVALIEAEKALFELREKAVGAITELSEDFRESL